MASQRLARLFPQGDGPPGRFWVDRGSRLPGRGDFPVKLQHLFDSHAHYEDALFGEDRHRILAGLPDQGVEWVLNCCSDLGVAPLVVALTEQYDFVYGSVGVHPHWVLETPEDYLDQLERLARSPKVVALGAMGFDYFFDEPRDLQERIFRGQMDLAQQLKLPVIIHDREAHEDTYRVLEEYKLPGIVHRFSGNVEGLRRVLDWGMYVSFNGDITWPEYNETALKVLAVTPMERLLIETDAPYMPPKVLEGQLCDSAMLPHIVEVIAQVKGLDPQEVCDISAKNAREIYGIN